MGSITSSNAVLMFSIASLYNSPQQLQGFAADDVFDTDVQEVAETLMGVDGRLSAGFVYNPINQSINLQADSPSNVIFETWQAYQQQIRDVYFANATITLISIGRKFTMTNGVLVSYPVMPDAKKVLQPRKYTVRWESVLPSPV